MDIISLEDTIADAEYTVDLIGRACPASKDISSCLEAEMASDEIDALVRAIKELYEDYCIEQGLPETQDTYLDYVAREIFSTRQERLLQTIELYHLLNFADRYCAEQPHTSLAKTFSRYANAENTKGLREFIESDLKDLKSGLPENSEDQTRDSVAIRHMLQKCERELNKGSADITDQNAHTVQFSMETIAAYTISSVVDELEFAAAVTIDLKTDHHESFQMRKKYLSELLQHLMITSKGMINEPDWKDGHSVPMAGRSLTVN